MATEKARNHQKSDKKGSAAPHYRDGYFKTVGSGVRPHELVATGTYSAAKVKPVKSLGDLVVDEKSVFSRLLKNEVLDLDDLTIALGISKQALSDTLGLSLASVSKKDRKESAKTQTRAREMVEILKYVEDWAGGPLQAFAWYRSTPIVSLGRRTAEALVKQGDAFVVRDYLDGVSLGAFA